MGAYTWQGIQIGLGLAILVGPIIVLLIQLSLEEGTLSSVCAALGIWASDLVYILLAHFGLGQLRTFIDHPNFEPIIGSIGGVILLIVGFAMWRRRPLKFRKVREHRRPRYWLSFAKGFGINLINPFPVVFWSTVSVGIVYEDHLNANQAWSLYVAIMITIMATDLLKVFAARYLRKWLTPDHARMVQRTGAGFLMFFGVILWVRVWFL